MKEYIITIIIGVSQMILSINLIIRQKNVIAIVSEIISSLILLFSLNNFSINLDTISGLYIGDFSYNIKNTLVAKLKATRVFCFYCFLTSC